MWSLANILRLAVETEEEKEEQDWRINAATKQLRLAMETDEE